MKAIQNILVRHLQEVQKGIVANMSRMHRTTSGRSVASLFIEQTSIEGLASASLSGDKQWQVMERGRGSGKVPHNFADIIKDWVLRKGISYQQLAPKSGSPEKGLTQLSYAIAHSIMTKGTKLHRESGYNDIFDTLIAQETEKLATESVGIIETEVDKINVEDEKD